MKNKVKLKRLHLADTAALYPRPEAASGPAEGWVRAVREALGMTQAQLARRTGVSRQSIQGFEAAEVDRRITLESLDRLADALQCRVVYALVPQQGTLDAVLEARADEVAEALLRVGSHSMNLEGQGVSASEYKRQHRLLRETLLREQPNRLWQ